MQKRAVKTHCSNEGSADHGSGEGPGEGKLLKLDWIEATKRAVPKHWVSGNQDGKLEGSAMVQMRALQIAHYSNGETCD